MVRRVFAVLVVGVLVLAPIMVAVAAADMAPAMSMADGCSGCPDGDADAGACKMICLNAAQIAVLTECEGPARVGGGDRRPAPRTALPGRSPAPDPAPPRGEILA
jgi:hypothetical protein